MRRRRHNSKVMHNWGFRMMVWMYNVMDLFAAPDRRLKELKIEEGMTVVDYGCGPGRYIRGFAHAVGDKGMVYAADVHELALKYVRCKIAKYHLENVEPVFIKGSSSLIPDKTADMICAFDMFHQVENPEEFLNELHRLAKKTCQLILDDGHQSREETLRKVSACRVWKIDEEHKDHLRCSPVY